MIETFSDEDKLLVRYLFNELDRGEAKELEDEMLLDEELAERAEVMEMNLIDCYVRHELTTSESLRFKEGYLADDENRDKVNRALMFHESLRLLHEKSPLAPKPLPNQGRHRVLPALFARPLPALALATAILLLIVGLMVFEIRRRADNTNSLATRPSPPANSANVNSSTRAPETIPPEDKVKDSGTELARNEAQKYTQYEYIHRQDWKSGERGGTTVQIILDPQVENLGLMYELIDDIAAQRKTYGVTIKNQYGERVWPQNRVKAEIKPVPTKGEKARKLIVVNVPIKLFIDDGPYSFEFDDQYLPAKQFTLKK